jgi:transposase
MPKINRTYPKEQKEAILTKLFPPNNITITEISAQSGIPKTTIYGWKKRALKSKEGLKNEKRTVNKITANKKFRVVMETYNMSEYDISRYCRENALYKSDVKKWRSDLESSFEKEPNAVKEIKEKLTEEKKKIKNLEKELSRKEKALAEAAALLVLQKKFQASMEEKED